MSIHVTACLNPFSTEKTEFTFEQGITVNEIIRNLDSLNAVNTGWRVMIDDEIVTDFERIPEENQRVYIKLVPEGDNKESGVGMKIAGGALAVVGVILMFTPASALGVCLVGAGVGLFSGGAVLYNMDIPGAREKPENDPSIRGSRNTPRPYGTVPMLFGRRRIYADPCANPYTWVDPADGSVYLYQLFCAGQKDLEVETQSFKIDETFLKDYSSTGNIEDVLNGTDSLIQLHVAYGENQTPLYNKCVHEIQLNTLLKHQTEEGLDGAIIRTTPDKTTEINVDIFAYNGLGKYNDKGKLESVSVTVKAEYKRSEAPDTDYQLLGYFNGESNVLSGSELKTRRFAITKANLSPAAYTIRVIRVSDDSTDSKVIDSIYVGSIRACKNEEPVRSEICRRTTLIGLKIKASEKLQNIIEQLNFIAQSRLPVYSSTDNRWSYEPSCNPASAAMYAMQGDFAQQKLTDSDIDLDAFQKLYIWCNEHKYECNAYVTESMSINELLSAIASTCRTEILRINGKVTVIQDIERSSYVQLFTPRNSSGYKETLSLGSVPDEMKLQFVDEESGFAENEVSVYNTPSGNKSFEPTTSQNIQLWGVTNRKQAQRLGMYKYAVSNHRFNLVKFSCDFEYLMCQKGDWIKYAGDIALAGLSQGRIAEQIVENGYVTGFECDEELPMEAGKSYAVRVRNSDGSMTLLNLRTIPGSSNTIRLENKILAAEAPRSGDLFAFGIRGNDSLDLIVTDIQCGENLTADLICVEYAPEIFGVDSDGFILPDYKNMLSEAIGKIDSGEVSNWQTWTTYNDSDKQPETPTGNGTSNGWHHSQTEASKWISTKTAESIFDGVWSAPLPSGSYVMGLLLPDGEVKEPDTIKGLNAVAAKDTITINWAAVTGDGLKNDIKCYNIEISKDNGSTWTALSPVETNNTVYTFDRSVDHYPEASTLNLWKVRVQAENIYGKQSEWTAIKVNTDTYGTWIANEIHFTNRIPSEGGINLAWNVPIGSNDRVLYGENTFTVTIKYNGVTRQVIDASTQYNTLYKFNREIDRYPEAVHDETHTGLDLYTFELKLLNESGSIIETAPVHFTPAEIDVYGTWIPTVSNFTKSASAEYGIDYEWEDAHARDTVLYGTNTYELKVYCGNTLRETIIKGQNNAIYAFNRNLDGYPEKPNVTGSLHTLDEFTATVKVINESGNTAISNPVDTTYATYLGWKPAQPTIETRSSGRACTISPYNPESRYGKIRYRYLVNNLAKDGNTFYLPTPLANYYESVENYRDSTKPNVPLVADSPYTQTMPLQGQDATAFKEYTWNGESTVEYNDGSSKQLKYYETDPSEDYETVDVETILIGENEVEVNYWFDSANNIHHASFEVAMANPQDTEYRFMVQAFNETANIAPDYNEPVSVTARATSAYDVVNGAITTNSLAPDAVTAEKIATGTITADKIFVRALAAISANLGKITDGELVGNPNNYWYLSDEYNEEGTEIIHHAGNFRVGTASGVDGDYIQCTTQNGTNYNISIHASKFEITAVGTLVHGEFYVCNAGQAVDSEGRPTSYYAKITSSGVVINGTLSVSGDVHIGIGKAIYADGSKANYPIIKMKDNTSGTDGNGIVIGGGGATVIGAGESADTYYSGASMSGATETMVVASDNNIVFASNLQSSYASRKEMTMGTDGKLTNVNGFVGNLTGNADTATTAYNGALGRLGGAFQSSKTNFADLIAEISGASSGGGIVGGSIYNVADKGIPAGWHNFLYIPHRTGIGGDNYKFGTLFVTDMTGNTNNFWVIHNVNGSINNAVLINANYASSAGTASSCSGNSATATKAERSAGGAWIKARDNCVAKQTTKTQSQGSSWNPVIGIKTWAGFWSMGTVGGESLCLSYDTDENYNKNNNTSNVINFPSGGGTIALTSSTVAKATVADRINIGHSSPTYTNGDIWIG